MKIINIPIDFEFKPIRLQLVIETKKEMELLKQLLSYDVIVPNCLPMSVLDKATLGEMMHKIRKEIANAYNTSKNNNAE